MHFIFCFFKPKKADKRAEAAEGMWKVFFYVALVIRNISDA